MPCLVPLLVITSAGLHLPLVWLIVIYICRCAVRIGSVDCCYISRSVIFFIVSADCYHIFRSAVFAGWGDCRLACVLFVGLMLVGWPAG